MRDFWRLAKMMLRHRGLLIAAMVFALLSAGGLTIGLVGVVPVVGNILGTGPNNGSSTGPGGGKGLQTLATEYNPKIGNIIPQSIIASLTNDPFLTVVYVLSALAGLAVLGGVFMFLNLTFANTAVARTTMDLRRLAFSHTVRMPLGTVQALGPKQIVNQIVNDSAVVGGGLGIVLNKTLAQALRGGAAVVFALVTNWLLTCIAIMVVVPLFYAIRVLSRKIRRASTRWLQAQGNIFVTTSESLDHLRVVKTNNAEVRAAEQFELTSAEMLRFELKARTARALASPITEVLTIFIVCGLTIAAAQVILSGHMQAAEFLVTLAALGIAGEALKPLTVMQTELQPSAAAAERLCALLREPIEQIDGGDKPALARHNATIRFENVWLNYPGQERPAVAGFSLEIRHGETVAFVGPNGSGKTTVLSLIPRLFEPDSGRILVDGTDIASVSLASLRAQIGVVTQEAVLFKGTILSNLTYGLDNHSFDEVRAAARRARAEEFILDKPGGYDAPIGENGTGLSGGQRQRVAIARAILRDPSILILDEATSMIDADSEAKIAEAISEFARGRTCMIVAHRLSTVVHADRIVVMDQGRIVGIGRHDDLMTRCEVYRLIADNQLIRHAPVAPATAV